MTYKATPSMLNGRIVELVFNDREQQVAYITDIEEYAIVPCLWQQMAERMALAEGVRLTVSH
jgi:hypothetical protein